eukprot:401080_1
MWRIYDLMRIRIVESSFSIRSDLLCKKNDNIKIMSDEISSMDLVALYQGKRQNTTTEMVQIYRSGGSCSMLVRTFAFQTIITAPNEVNLMMKTPRHACGMAVIEHKHNE